MNSMTGFGKSEAASEGRKIRVEIKTVNHRFLDMSIRAPHFVAPFEGEIRNQLRRSLSRGRVEVVVVYGGDNVATAEVLVNMSLAAAYAKAAQYVSANLGLPNDLTVSHVLELPDVVSFETTDAEAEKIRSLVAKATQGALDELIASRRAEGSELLSDMELRLDLLEAAVKRIANREDVIVSEYRERLRLRIEELAGDIELDGRRLEQEVAIFADRCNVTEEVVRVFSHIEQFRKLTRVEGPVGKNLDFLVQELNREFNTIGSKSQDAEVTGAVISAKAEIEKIREQIQNIE